MEISAGPEEAEEELPNEVEIEEEVEPRPQKQFEPLPFMNLPFKLRYQILEKMESPGVMKLMTLHSFFGRYVVQSRSRFETMVVWRSDFPGLTRVDLDGSPITWEQFRGLFSGQRKTFKVSLLYLSGRRKAVQVSDKFLEMAHQARFRAREIQLSSTNTDPGVMALVAESCPETITVTDTSGSADEYLPVPETCRNLSIYWNRRAPNFEEPNQYKVAPVVDLTKATGLEKIEINCREQKRMMTPLAMVAFNNLRLGIKIDQAKQSLIDELHETFIGIPVWRFLESDHRYYMLHQNVSFFIEKSAEVAS